MIIAVDIGGTKTLVAAFEGSQAIASEERFATPQDVGEFIEVLMQKLAQFPASQVEAIIIAVPGMLAADGTILRCGNLPWRNVHLKDLIAQRFDCPIYQENDANLAGLGETHALESVPALSLYVTISTGIGTGVITHGRIDAALSNSEAGHMVFDYQGKPTVWEDFASGSAIQQQYGKQASDVTDAMDWQQIVHNLAVGFSALIPVLQPNIVLVGGGVGAHFDLFSAKLQTEIRQRLPAYISTPEFRQATHPEEAVIYGCYYYATHQRPS